MRALPPVHSPIGPGDLLRGAAAAAGLTGADRGALDTLLRHTYGARDVILCDSGTSAMVNAFKLVARGRPMRVACPAYICVDVGSAAQAAGVELILYDTDPATLSPDMDSLDRVLRTGVGAVVIAHLYGYPVAVDDVRKACGAHGVPLIEDAAQEAGAIFNHRRAGSFGDLSVLSFGRGKGATGGGGGALLVAQDSPISAEQLPRTRLPSGWRQWAATVAQWGLGRPSLYWLPLAVPGLRLGEMVYHPAHPPTAISRASIALVLRSLRLQDRAVGVRRANALRIGELVTASGRARAIRGLDGALPSFLRFPIVDERSALSASNRVGAVRGYPRLLDEDDQLGVVASRKSEGLPGATELRDRLFTVPTHELLSERDLLMIGEWLSGKLV